MMAGLVLALVGAYGVLLLYAEVTSPRDQAGDTVVRPVPTGRRRPPFAEWLVQAGLDDVRPAEFASVVGLLFVAGAAGAWALFGGVLPPLVAGAFAASFPAATARARRERRRHEAQEAWPRMIEEIRLLTGSLGRSIPQALLEVGRRAPEELRPAFAAAEREWLLSTDFARTTRVLKARLADPTADATCETLLVAHEVGGSDLDRRLAALAENRADDLRGRKDARAKQSGVRFARRFVLVVPIGMAVAGLSIGSGREAYGSFLGQVLVAVGLVVVVLCWVWAGRLMRLPEEERVFP